jgi:hypothetical protein
MRRCWSPVCWYCQCGFCKCGSCRRPITDRSSCDKGYGSCWYEDRCSYHWEGSRWCCCGWSCPDCICETSTDDSWSTGIGASHPVKTWSPSGSSNWFFFVPSLGVYLAPQTSSPSAPSKFKIFRPDTHSASHRGGPSVILRLLLLGLWNSVASQS